MKEYKFRGFDAVGDKRWVYGDLVHNLKITKERDLQRTMVGGYEVVPESVGLFTGKKDCGGREIYEGDILCVMYKGKKLFDATVKWIDWSAGFMIDEGNGCKSPIPSSDMVEIIGNVYERGL